MVSKKQIANGVAMFIENDLICDISDSQIKLVLSIAKDTLKKNADVLDVFLENPMIESVISEDNGMYEISDFADTLKKVISDCGNISIVIPSIPLLSPNEKKIHINDDDIRLIMNYIKPEEKTGISSLVI